jgi:hypothetical protein
MDSRFSVSLSYVQLWSCWFSKVASKLWENALCSDVFEWLLYTPHPHTQLCIICTIVCDCCVILCVDIKHKVSMEKQVEYMTSQIIHMLIFFQPTTFNIAVLYIFFLHPHIIHCLLTKVWSQNQVDPIHDLRSFSCALERIKLDTTLNSLQYLVYYASYNQCFPVLGFDKNLKFGFYCSIFFLRNLECSSAKPNNSCIRNWPEKQTSTLNQLVAACNLSHLQE